MKPELEDQLREHLSPAHADGLACSRQLYAFAAGELSDLEAEAFQRHARECPACRLDLASFERQAAAVEPRRHRFWYGPGLVLAGAAAVSAIALWPRGQSDQPSAGAPATLQVKGGPQLQIAIRRGGQDRVASPGQVFVDGDTLGFFYSSAQPVWPVVFYGNQQGNVTRIYPKAEPELMPPATAAPLPAGALVEPASGCEWLVAFFAPESAPPSIDRLAEVVRQALSAPGPGCVLDPVSPGLATQVWPLLRSPSR